MIESHVEALLTGRPERVLPGGGISAIARRPATGKLRLGWTGFAGDEVADKRHHGGPDKAFHVFAAEHYQYYREALGGHELLTRPGAFGENVVAPGLTEDCVCLGDRFRIGSALVEVSHGRQPCNTLARRFEHQDIVALVVASRRCGLYFRVIDEGEVGAGDAFVQIETGDVRWPIADVFDLLVAGKHRGRDEALTELSDHPLLAQAWRQRARALRC